MYDNICKYLAETYPEDIAKWLLGQPIPLVHLPTRELALEPIHADSLILLKSATPSENLILHLEFQTKPDPAIPFRMLDYWTRAKRKFPHHYLKQIVIYLTPRDTAVVYQNYYQEERTRHEFDIVRLWEREASALLDNPGTLPFAVLGRSGNREETLQAVVNRIEKLDNQRARRELAAASYVLAGLVLRDNVIRRILRSEMMRESVTFQAILEEGRQEGLQRGEFRGKQELLKRLIRRKFGALPPTVVTQLENLSSAQLDELGEAILDMQSTSDLEGWLGQKVNSR